VPAPSTLYLFRWRGRTVFLRLAFDGRPPCPRLYDEVIEIPVVARGEQPAAPGMRVVPLVADWLADLTQEDEHA
jgi:hypothetical protein